MPANVGPQVGNRQTLTMSAATGHLVGVPTRSLEGRRIVITRSEADARPLARRLEALGATAIVLPMIQVEWADPAPLDAAIASLKSYHWVIFTSRNGVRAFFRRAKKLEGPRVAAVGPATAAALREQGVEPDLVPDEHVGDALALALGDVAGRKVLMPRADIARREVAEDLRRRGATVDDLAVYHTRPAPGPRPDLAGVDAVTFTSSSTVRNFVQAGPVPAGARVVCIGPVTAATARELGLQVTEVAGDYTEEGLITALIEAFGK